jgi:ABC-2 type transport system ATP-binding protein
VERVDAAPAADRWQLRLYGEADGAAASVFAAAADGGREVIELRRIEGTLEDVFVHLTGRELRG